MKIRLKLFANLREKLPPSSDSGEAVMELAEGTTVGELIRTLAIDPASAKLIMVNGRQSQPAEVLKDGDQLAIFPPVAGG